MRNISEAEDSARRLLDMVTELGRSYPLRDPLAQVVEEMVLTPTQFHAHAWIGRDGPLTMGDLARLVGVTEKTMTGVVDRLERKGLVGRGRLASDRRVVEVSLTPKGEALWADIDSQCLKRTSQFLNLLPEEDREALLRIVEAFVERLAATRKGE